MAELNTSIPMSGQSVQLPDWMSLARNFSSIQASNAQTQNAQAQLPGTIAQSSSAQSQATKDKIGADGAQFVVQAGQDPGNLNPDGTLNRAKVADLAEQAGYLGVATQIRNDTAGAEQAAAQAEQARIKTQMAQREPDFYAAVQQATPQFTSAGPDGQPVTDQKALAQFLSKDWPVESQALYSKVLSNSGADIANSTNENDRQAKLVKHVQDVAGVTSQGLPNLAQSDNKQHYINGQAEGLYAIDPASAVRLFGQPTKNANGSRQWPVNDPSYFAAMALTPAEKAQLAATNAGTANTNAATTSTLQGVGMVENGLTPTSQLSGERTTQAANTGNIAAVQSAIPVLDKAIAANPSIGSRTFNELFTKVTASGDRAALQAVLPLLKAQGFDTEKSYQDAELRNILGTALTKLQVNNAVYNRNTLTPAQVKAGGLPAVTGPQPGSAETLPANPAAISNMPSRTPLVGRGNNAISAQPLPIGSPAASGDSGGGIGLPTGTVREGKGRITYIKINNGNDGDKNNWKAKQ